MTTGRPGGIPYTTRDVRVSLLDWDAHTMQAVDRWLGDTPHRWEDGQLVLTRFPEGNDSQEMRPRPGWVLVGWPDGAVTVASARTADRLYQPSTEETA